MELVLGTKNPHKVEELRRALSGLALRALPDFIPEVDEDAGSFHGNATKKAVAYAHATGALCLADDSGLCVAALQGAPGVDSATYAGEPRSHERNNEKLLAALAGIPDADRGAEFVCVLALADPQGLRLLLEGRLTGRILEVPRGQAGFGYDPLFLVPGLGRSLAELGLEEKNLISHRGRALAQLQRVLITQIFTEPN